MRGMLALLLIVTLAGGECAAAADETDNGEDITRPRTRLDVRYQYQNQPADTHDSQHTFTLRTDRPFDLAPGWRFGTRADLPFVYTDATSADHADGAFGFGLGDALVQGLLINLPTPDFAWAVGARFVFPTGTQDRIGAGKYRIVPTVGARQDLDAISDGSWITLAARYDLSYAGDDGRRDIRELQFAPMFNLALPDGWFVTVFSSTDIRYNLGEKRPGDSGRWFVPLDFTVGTLINKTTIASLEIGVPLIKDYDLYDFKIEARLGFFF